MAFPQTSILTDFTVLPDNGPPPSASYENGPVDPGGMEIGGGLCFPSDGVSGNAQWIANEFGPMYEVFAKLGCLDPLDDVANLTISSLDGSIIYILEWLITLPTADINIWSDIAGDFNLLTTLSGIAIAIDDQIGIRAQDNSIIVYVNGIEVGSFSGVTLPSLGYIGFGSYVVD